MIGLERTPSTKDYTQMDHLIRHKDYYANAKYQITKHWLLEFIRPGMHLLNVGCGGGEFNTIAVEMGLSVTAFEPEPEAYELALRRLPPVNCEVLQLDLFSINPNIYRADVVVMHDVLEHIEDDTQAVCKIATLIKPGGRGIISVPALQELFGYHDLQLGHHRRYSKSSLERVLSPFFRVRRLRYFGMSFIPITLWHSRIRGTSYSIDTLASNSLKSHIWRILCLVESSVSLPVGTSLLAEVEPNARLIEQR